MGTAGGITGAAGTARVIAGPTGTAGIAAGTARVITGAAGTATGTAGVITGAAGTAGVTARTVGRTGCRDALGLTIAADRTIPMSAAALGRRCIYIDCPATIAVPSITIFIPVVRDRTAGIALVPVTGVVAGPALGPVVFVGTVAITRIGGNIRIRRICPALIFTRLKVAGVIGVCGEGVVKGNVVNYGCAR